MERNMEIEKGIEDEILKELSNSETFWTDLYPFMKKSKYSFPEFYEILKELVDSELIKSKNKEDFIDLKLTKKGKLVGRTYFYFKLTEKGHLRLRNDLYILEENSTNKITAKINAKGQTSILQNVYWVIGIIVFLTAIHVFIEKQFELNIIKWVINKF